MGKGLLSRSWVLHTGLSLFLVSTGLYSLFRIWGQSSSLHGLLIFLHIPPLWKRQRCLNAMKVRETTSPEPAEMLEAGCEAPRGMEYVNLGLPRSFMVIFSLATRPLSTRLLRCSLRVLCEKSTSSKSWWKSQGLPSLSALIIRSSNGSILRSNEQIEI